MRRLITVMVIALAGCAAKPGPGGGVFRVADAPIYSNAAFDFARLEGNWQQSADFAPKTKAACNSDGVAFAPVNGAMAVTYQLCLGGIPVSGSGIVTPSGPGRFGISGTKGVALDWWVIWVDEGYRTLAIGTPSGAFGFVLNKGGSLPKDRLLAAREVFDFNGYDVERLVVYSK